MMHDPKPCPGETMTLAAWYQRRGLSTVEAYRKAYHEGVALDRKRVSLFAKIIAATGLAVAWSVVLVVLFS